MDSQKKNTELKDDSLILIFRFIYILISVIQGMPVITFILGTWQVERWRWKLDLIEKLKQRTTTEPINLPIE